jgi:NADH-quinone oxidoreductase subunit C
MPDNCQTLSSLVQQRFADCLQSCVVANGELTIEVPALDITSVCQALRDEEAFGFDELIDLCGVDYLDYANGAGWDKPRFAVVYHLLSIVNNQRIRVRAFVDGQDPVIDSVVPIWNCANWFEREAFDLFGILFDGHPDLRRLLTDYGFIGHPFRKDFPLVGNVEMRYDPEKQRVVYEPVTLEERINVPRVIRDDHRYIGNAANDEVSRG